MKRNYIVPKSLAMNLDVEPYMQPGSTGTIPYGGPTTIFDAKCRVLEDPFEVTETMLFNGEFIQSVDDEEDE